MDGFSHRVDDYETTFKLEQLSSDQLKSRVLKTYSELLHMINMKTMIKMLERGCIHESDGFFRDYFDSPHGDIEKDYNLDTSFYKRVIKITFSDETSKTLTTSIDHHNAKNILFLDNLVENLHPNIRKIFTDKLLELRTIEGVFFRKKKLGFTKNELIGNLSD